LVEGVSCDGYGLGEFYFFQGGTSGEGPLADGFGHGKVYRFQNETSIAEGELADGYDILARDAFEGGKGIEGVRVRIRLDACCRLRED
jgi:hypothetical protein